VFAAWVNAPLLVHLHILSEAHWGSRSKSNFLKRAQIGFRTSVGSRPALIYAAKSHTVEFWCLHLELMLPCLCTFRSFLMHIEGVAPSRDFRNGLELASVRQLRDSQLFALLFIATHSPTFVATGAISPCLI
jgi:hypothetical protein